MHRMAASASEYAMKYWLKNDLAVALAKLTAIITMVEEYSRAQTADAAIQRALHPVRRRGVNGTSAL